jgi:hypothetical protein
MTSQAGARSCRRCKARTYERLRSAHDRAEARSTFGLMRWVNRVQRRANRAR